MLTNRTIYSGLRLCQTCQQCQREIAVDARASFEAIVRRHVATTASAVYHRDYMLYSAMRKPELQQAYMCAASYMYAKIHSTQMLIEEYEQRGTRPSKGFYTVASLMIGGVLSPDTMMRCASLRTTVSASVETLAVLVCTEHINMGVLPYGEVLLSERDPNRRRDTCIVLATAHALWMCTLVGTTCTCGTLHAVQNVVFEPTDMECGLMAQSHIIQAAYIECLMDLPRQAVEATADRIENPLSGPTVGPDRRCPFTGTTVSVGLYRH